MESRVCEGRSGAGFSSPECLSGRMSAREEAKRMTLAAVGVSGNVETWL